MARCGSDVCLNQFQFGEAPLTCSNAHTRGEKCPLYDGYLRERFLESSLHNMYKDSICLPVHRFLPSAFLIQFDVSTKTMNLCITLAMISSYVSVRLWIFMKMLLPLDRSIRSLSDVRNPNSMFMSLIWWVHQVTSLCSWSKISYYSRLISSCNERPVSTVRSSAIFFFLIHRFLEIHIWSQKLES